MAKRTQSTGVPSVAKPTVPSPKSTSSTHSGRRVVITAADRGAVAVGRDDRQLDPGHLQQRAAQRLQALGLDPVVVGEQDPHGPAGYLVRDPAAAPGAAAGACSLRRARPRGSGSAPSCMSSASGLQYIADSAH